MSKPTFLKDILKDLSKSLGFKLESISSKLLEAWREVSGEIISKNAHPYSFKRGTLKVICSSPHWAFELNMLKEDLKERLNQRLGEGKIREIRFLVGEISSPSFKREERIKIELDPKEVEAILSPLKDEALRESALKILEGIKRNLKGKP